MFSTIAVLTLLATEAIASPRVVPMKLQSRRRTSPSTLAKRDFTASLQNYLPGLEYFVAVTVGTPPQDIELIVDTGSSDIWMFAPDVCKTSKVYGPCLGGTFDTSGSSTYTLVSSDSFQIQYADGSGVKGNYIKDTFRIGGQNVTNQIMALATSDSSNVAGIMGIGLDTRESLAYGQSTYQNLPDSMKNQGLISTKAYSLYLDDSESQDGSLLFGGYDTAKFYGDLTMIDLTANDAFSIPWVSTTINTANGSIAIKPTSNFPAAVTLDSGSTLISVPTNIFSALASIFGASATTQLVSCDLMSEVGSISFGFGSTSGPVISVPFSELARPIYNGDGDWETDSTGEKACEFGIADAGSGAGGDLLFGQTLLRSAYVLYDLDNLKLGIAQARYDTNTSSIVEYTGTNTQNIVSLSGSQAVPAATGGVASSFAFSNMFGTSAVQTALPSAASVTVPRGATTIANGVVAYSTSNTVSQPSIPNTGFPSVAPTLTSLDSAASRKDGQGAAVFAVVFGVAAAVFGGGIFLL